MLLLPTSPITAANPSDFTQITWTESAQQPQFVSEAQSVVFNDKLYSFGGFGYDMDGNTSYIPTRRVYVYDPAVANPVWTPLSNMPIGVSHSGFASDGTYIYYAGGYIENAAGTGQVYGTKQVWRYNPADDTYFAMPQLPEKNSTGMLGFVNGKLHYIGGTDRSPDPDVDLPSHYTFDLVAYANNPFTRWVNITQTAGLPNPRQHAALLVIDDLIYYVGGQTNHDGDLEPQDDVHRYDPVLGTWAQLADMPGNGRNHNSWSTLYYNGRILVFAGQKQADQVTNTIYAYSLASNTWTQLASTTPYATHSAIGGVINDVIYFGTGAYGGANKKTLWIGVPQIDPPADLTETAVLATQTAAYTQTAVPQTATAAVPQTATAAVEQTNAANFTATSDAIQTEIANLTATTDAEQTNVAATATAAYTQTNIALTQTAAAQPTATFTPTLTLTYTSTFVITETPSAATLTPTGTVATLTPTLGSTATLTPTGTLTALTPTLAITSTSSPTATVPPILTATSTPVVGIELLINGSFELDMNDNKIPDDWTPTTLTGDKRKCNKTGKPPVGFEGVCAMVFKGSVGEDARIMQKVDLTLVTLNTGDTLTLNAQVNGNQPTVSGKVIVKVKYTDALLPKGKITIEVGQTTGYIPVTQSLVVAGSVSKLKAQITHSSATGKLTVDAMSLTLLPAVSALIPLPGN
ncbi:MAG: hypothetical protein H7Y11_10170 [Armatimonadetes bacterium]|nr:hypothetical protein [Anaerolineae bacterium]